MPGKQHEKITAEKETLWKVRKPTKTTKFETQLRALIERKLCLFRDDSCMVISHQVCWHGDTSSLLVTSTLP
ncbi:MAG: hypothetical protein NTV22_14680 [bacterium]|nr:hypothetical protein [bacterium]